jgi:hypothetical protein
MNLIDHESHFIGTATVANGTGEIPPNPCEFTSSEEKSMCDWLSQFTQEEQV